MHSSVHRSLCSTWLLLVSGTLAAFQLACQPPCPTTCLRAQPPVHVWTFPSKPTWLLAFDLDGTLVDRHNPSRQRGARRQLFAALAKLKVAIVYITGRDLAEVIGDPHSSDPVKRLGAIQRFSLPKPDFIVTLVGTAIYTRQKGDWVPDSQWKLKLSACWNPGYAIPSLRAFVRRYFDLRPNGATITPGPNGKPVALNQGPRHQRNPYKISYTIPRPTLSAPAMYKKLHRVLLEARLNATLLVSKSQSKPRLYLDITPPQPCDAKGGALRSIAKRLNLGLDRVFVAGDSGNDRTSLVATFPRDLKNGFATQIPSKCRVFVGPIASPWRKYFNDLSRTSVSLAASGKRRSPPYLARAEMVEGVIEGLRHCGVLPLR